MIILHPGAITAAVIAVAPEAPTVAVPDAGVEPEVPLMKNVGEVPALSVPATVIAMGEGPLPGLPEMNLSWLATANALKPPRSIGNTAAKKRVLSTDGLN